jgi:hypothetical protein
MSIYDPRPRLRNGQFRSHIAALINEMRLAGIEPANSHTGGGHIRFEWRAGDKRQIYFTSGTPSDWRTARNARADIPRKLRGAL